MKIFVASFSRSSDGAISRLVDEMKKEDIWTHTPYEADYILAIGDRKETYHFVLREFEECKKIIHLWAGEISQGCTDEIYRHSMTLMSTLQLCTNPQAKKVVESLFNVIGMKSNAHIIGNVMLDNLIVDESIVPNETYNLILYNPPTLCTPDEIRAEIQHIDEITKDKNRIWISPNGDKHSDLVQPFVNTDNLPRPQFLGLLKNCKKYITSSSSAYYEAKFLMKEEDIIMIGKRNKNRNSKDDMDIPNATENIIKILKELK